MTFRAGEPGPPPRSGLIDPGRSGLGAEGGGRSEEHPLVERLPNEEESWDLGPHTQVISMSEVGNGLS